MEFGASINFRVLDATFLESAAEQVRHVARHMEGADADTLSEIALLLSNMSRKLAESDE